MKVYIATMETRNFTFEGVGTDESRAIAALNAGLEAHRRQYRLPYGWDSNYDFTIRTLTTGTAYRDSEEIAR
jgi:hypothetical protein